MNRRDFLRVSSFTAGAWILSEIIPPGAAAGSIQPEGSFFLNKLIKISTDGKVTLFVQKQEMGQGVRTALPMILAEELDVSPADISVETLSYDPKAAGSYNTYASASIKGSWAALRNAGAAAREMLIASAAAKWNVPVAACKAELSKVSNLQNGQTFQYSQLVQDASKLQVPARPTLKDISDFKLIGKRMARPQIEEILSGRLKYGIDVKLPGMVYAAVVRAPMFYGKAKTWDDTAVRRLGKGIVDIIEIPQLGKGADNRNGVAVLATNTWLAFKAARLLKVEWDIPQLANPNSAKLSQNLADALTSSPAALTYDATGKSKTFTKLQSDSAFTSTFELPYLAHLAMEPMNCTAWYHDDKYELWGGFQAPGAFATILPDAFGIPKESIFINLLPMGGAFGRKEKVDNAAEAMFLSKAASKPVQVIFSREDDTQNDFYRPASFHSLSAVAGPENIYEWSHELAIATFPGKAINTPQDIYGGPAADLPYPVENYRSAFYPVESAIPIGSWRSISYNHNVFAVESFIDELAARLKIDPVAYRQKIFSNNTDQKRKKGIQRLQAVIQKCAEAIKWDTKPATGRYRGFAICEYVHTEAYVAQAFEVSVSASKAVTIHNVVCAIDCGIIVDPDGFRAQVEGSLAWGLSALKGEISISNGKVEQHSFYDYPVLRINELPPYQIIVVSSGESPGGAGEPAIPALAPALCNAIAAATGIRIRKLPLIRSGFTFKT